MGVLSSVGAPYYISEGSLLHLYRDCGLGQSDLDLVLDLAWWTEANSRDLQEELAAQGFTRSIKLGQLEQVGYEESYTKDGIKVIHLSLVLTIVAVSLVYRLTSSLPPARNTTRREQFAPLDNG